jgi:hypothetical protein
MPGFRGIRAKPLPHGRTNAVGGRYSMGHSPSYGRPTGFGDAIARFEVRRGATLVSPRTKRSAAEEPALSLPKGSGHRECACGRMSPLRLPSAGSGRNDKAGTGAVGASRRAGTPLPQAGSLQGFVRRPQTRTDNGPSHAGLGIAGEGRLWYDRGRSGSLRPGFVYAAGGDLEGLRRETG